MTGFRIDPILVLAALGCLYGAAANLATAQVLDEQGERFHDLDLFGAVAHRWLDEDCDGSVPLEDFAEVSGSSLDEPETEARLREYDPDEDGEISPSEIAEGIRAGVRAQVELAMLVDANDDGALSLKEHALGFPDPEGERNENGLTSRQISSFRFFDRDGDQRITRQEITERHRMTFLVILWAQIVAKKFERVDADGDGLVRLDELVKGLGHDSEDGLTSEQAVWFDTLATPRGEAPAISLRVFRIQLLQDRPVSSRMAMERPIRPLLQPDCPSSVDIAPPRRERDNGAPEGDPS